MRKIGITGGIGSGKTTACRVFETLGIPIYDADTRAKSIMITDLSVKSKIKSLLGNEAYHKNGKINKDHVSAKIFNNKQLLKEINDIVHPAVLSDSLRWIEEHKKEKDVPYIIKEAALLIETGSYKSLDKLIVVTCPEEIRIKRVMKRDGLSYEAVKRKIDNQLPEEEKIRYADYIINNDDTQSVIHQVWYIHQQLTK